MSGDYNKVILMGRLTRDVELRNAGQTTVGAFGLATGRKFKTASGEQRDETTFVDCEAWGRTAEVMAQYLAKGRPVFVEGRLKFEQWQDKDGSKRTKLKVVVESCQFIDSGGGQQQGGPSPEPRGTVYSGGVDADDLPF